MKILVGLVGALFLVGCEGDWSKHYDPVAPGSHIVPTHSIQSGSLAELKRAPDFGYSIIATGKGTAINSAGEPTRLEPGERLEIISIDPDRNVALVRRVAYNSFATVAREALTVKGSY